MSKISKFNKFQPSIAVHVETSHLICTADLMIGFYMMCSTGLKWVKILRKAKKAFVNPIQYKN